MEFCHQSVLLEESIENLRIRPEGIYADGTLGGGGHSYEICRRLSQGGRLIGIDQDAAAIEAAGRRLEEFAGKATIVRSNYCHMRAELAKLGITSIDGVILDLGGFLLSTGSGRPRVYLQRGRAAGHADGSEAVSDSQGCCERLQRDGALPHHPGLRGRPIRQEHCPAYCKSQTGKNN